MSRGVTCPRCDGTGGPWLTQDGWSYDRDESGAVTSMSWWGQYQERRPCPLCRGTGVASMLDPIGAGGFEQRAMPEAAS